MKRDWALTSERGVFGEERRGRACDSRERKKMKLLLLLLLKRSSSSRFSLEQRDDDFVGFYLLFISLALIQRFFSLFRFGCFQTETKNEEVVDDTFSTAAFFLLLSAVNRKIRRMRYSWIFLQIFWKHSFGLKKRKYIIYFYAVNSNPTINRQELNFGGK